MNVKKKNPSLLWEISFGVEEDVWSAVRRIKLQVSLRSDESSVSFFANTRVTRREMMLVSKVIGKVVRTV